MDPQDAVLLNGIEEWKRDQAELYGSCQNNTSPPALHPYLARLDLPNRLERLDKEVEQHVRLIRNSGYPAENILSRLEYFRSRCILIEVQPQPVLEYARKEKEIVQAKYQMKVKLLGGDSLWFEEVTATSENRFPVLKFYLLPESDAQRIDPNSTDPNYANGSHLCEVLSTPTRWRWEKPTRLATRRKPARGRGDSASLIDDDIDEEEDGESPSVEKVSLASSMVDRNGRGVYVHTFQADVFGRQESRKLKEEVPFRHYYGLVCLNGHRVLSLPCVLVSNYSRQMVHGGGDRYFTNLMLFYGKHLPPPYQGEKDFPEKFAVFRMNSPYRHISEIVDYLDRVVITRLNDGRKSAWDKRGFNTQSKQKIYQMLQAVADPQGQINWQMVFTKIAPRSKSNFDNIFFDLLREMRSNASFLRLFTKDYCIGFAEREETEKVLKTITEKDAMILRVSGTLDDAHLVVSFWKDPMIIKHLPIKFNNLIKDFNEGKKPYDRVKWLLVRDEKGNGDTFKQVPIKDLRKILGVEAQRKNENLTRGRTDATAEPYSNCYSTTPPSTQKLLEDLKRARETVWALRKGNDTLGLLPSIEFNLEDSIRKLEASGVELGETRPDSNFSHDTSVNSPFSNGRASVDSNFTVHSMDPHHNYHSNLAKRNSATSNATISSNESEGTPNGFANPPNVEYLKQPTNLEVTWNPNGVPENLFKYPIQYQPEISLIDEFLRAQPEIHPDAAEPSPRIFEDINFAEQLQSEGGEIVAAMQSLSSFGLDTPQPPQTLSNGYTPQNQFFDPSNPNLNSAYNNVQQ